MEINISAELAKSQHNHCCYTNHITIVKSKKITAANPHLLIMTFANIRYLKNPKVKLTID